MKTCKMCNERLHRCEFPITKQKNGNIHIHNRCKTCTRIKYRVVKPTGSAKIMLKYEQLVKRINKYISRGYTKVRISEKTGVKYDKLVKWIARYPDIFPKHGSGDV